MIPDYSVSVPVHGNPYVSKHHIQFKGFPVSPSHLHLKVDALLSVNYLKKKYCHMSPIGWRSPFKIHTRPFRCPEMYEGPHTLFA